MQTRLRLDSSAVRWKLSGKEISFAIISALILHAFKTHFTSFFSSLSKERNFFLLLWSTSLYVWRYHQASWDWPEIDIKWNFMEYETLRDFHRNLWARSRSLDELVCRLTRFSFLIANEFILYYWPICEFSCTVIFNRD